MIVSVIAAGIVLLLLVVFLAGMFNEYCERQYDWRPLSYSEIVRNSLFFIPIPLMAQLPELGKHLKWGDAMPLTSIAGASMMILFLLLALRLVKRTNYVFGPVLAILYTLVSTVQSMVILLPVLLYFTVGIAGAVIGTFAGFAIVGAIRVHLVGRTMRVQTVDENGQKTVREYTVRDW